MSEFEVFKEILLGGLTKEQLIHQLTAQGVQFNEYAKILFKHPSFSIGNNVEKVQLVKIKQRDLGITNICTFDGIVKRALELNLRLCPLCLGAYLRLNYLEQPEGPYLTIASLKPEADENYPNGFYVRNLDNSLWLRGYRASDDYEWPLEYEFIFLK